MAVVDGSGWVSAVGGGAEPGRSLGGMVVVEEQAA